MSEKVKKYFLHFIIFVMDMAFSYLHKTYDIYYDWDCQEFFVESKKGDDNCEESCI